MLLEEIDELWDDIKADDHAKARQEAVQCGAMILSLILEVFDE